MRHHIQARINEDTYRRYNMARSVLGFNMEQFIIAACDEYVQAHSEEIQALAQTTQKESNNE